ncbi:hypothetical protein JQC92_15210 [Shewanella sp. 202IG2-18]|uniref:hypothetical protein n=1 Tax=Parashewanella hymeniacidonis TaxID=2807618 RepID=UPI001961A028|nr:hypothetical protein [Parashewanella hymeniacidonis]MBM7073363.1 hypothetical protein [Parashewanella hymeniacidonis]
MISNMKEQVKDVLNKKRTSNERYVSAKFSFTCDSDGRKTTKTYKITADFNDPANLRVKRTGFKAAIVSFFCFGGKLSSKLAEVLVQYIHPLSSGSLSSQSASSNTVSSQRRTSVAEQSDGSSQQDVSLHHPSSRPLPVSSSNSDVISPENIQVQPHHLKFLSGAEKDYDGKPLCDRFLYLGLLLGMTLEDIIARALDIKNQSESNDKRMKRITHFAIEAGFTCREFYHLLEMTRTKSCVQINRAIDKVGIERSLPLPQESEEKLNKLDSKSQLVDFRKLVAVKVEGERGKHENVNILEALLLRTTHVALSFNIDNHRLEQLKADSNNDDYVLLALILCEIKINNPNLSWQQFRDKLHSNQYLQKDTSLFSALDTLC